MEGLPEGSEVRLYDMMGRAVLTAHGTAVDVSGLKGVYLLRATAPDGRVFTEKLIVE